MKKGLWFGGVVLVVVCFVGAVLLNNSKPKNIEVPQEEVAQWKTFSWNEYNFAIDYPMTWSTSIGLGGELFIRDGVIGPDHKQVQVTISPDDRPFNDIVANNRMADHPFSSTTIYGIPAVVINEASLLLQHNGFLYQISLTPPSDPIIQKMIQSIKIFKPQADAS